MAIILINIQNLILNKLAFIGNKKELLNGANILHFKNMFHEINYRYMVGIF